MQRPKPLLFVLAPTSWPEMFANAPSESVAGDVTETRGRWPTSRLAGFCV